MIQYFFVKIGKGGKFGNTFIGHTEHSCIVDDLDRVVGLEPGPEVRISSGSHFSRM